MPGPVMRWEKLGRIFVPDGRHPHLKSHAAVPTLERLEGDLAIFVISMRDAEGRSHPVRVAIDLAALRVVEADLAPLLALGRNGTFDDSGIMPCWITAHEGRRHLYYIGWNRGVTVPFQNSLGLAVERDGRYEKVAEGPILGRGRDEPFFVASCAVLQEDARWRMWYLSCLGWERAGAGWQHRYHIKYAESDSPDRWQPTGRVAVDFAAPDEYAISRPWVLKRGGLYHMWYSVRGAAYRIGYASSSDGIDWQRRDGEAGIDCSPGEWDGEMIEYPCVFEYGSDLFMAYNGNGYGLTGFGLARLATPL